MAEQPTGTVTLLFTDIEGSTRLLERLGTSRYAEALDLHRRLLREAFDRHGAYEVDYEGDSFFIAFASASEAVAAAADAQQALAQAAWPEGLPIRVRMGIHVGKPLAAPPKYVGVDVHKAARVMAAGHGGQVLLSQATRDLLDESVELRDLGEHRLKDLAEAVWIFQLGPAEFPPLRSLSNTNLPLSASRLVGRERELADLCQLLRSEELRLVTLTGTGGTGKTRLALAVARELLQEFPNGVFFAALAPLADSTLVVPTIAQVLGVRERAGEPLLESLKEHLRGKRLLLVLDNFEHLLEVAPVVAETLEAAGGLSVLVTSRERLRLRDEREYALMPLSEADAVELFSERARAADPEADFEHDEAVAEICRRLDRLPLAIELAAVRVKLLQPAALLARLEQSLSLLSGGARDVPERQQTLRATIAWSYELLDERERRMFARLSVFPAGCMFEDAETVCEADPEALQSLIDKSLIRRRGTEFGPRFWMLETIREFASERLEDEGERPSVEARLIDAAVEFALAAEPCWRMADADDWLHRFDLERDNLRRAIRAALDRGDGERALTIAAYLGWLWQERGLLREGCEWHELALALASRGDLEPGLEGYANFSLGALTAERGDSTRGEKLMRRSLSLLAAGGRPHDHALALYYLGLEIAGRDPDEAEKLFRKGELEARRLRDGTLIGSALGGLAHCAALRGDRAHARTLYEEVLALELPNRMHRVIPLVSLANMLVVDGELNEAKGHLDEALAIGEQAGYGRELAFVHLSRGCLQLARGRQDAAVASLSAAHSIAEESGARGGIADAVLGFAGVEARWGRPEEAVRLWSQARAMGVPAADMARDLRTWLELEFLDPLRARLGEEAFERVWAAARTGSPKLGGATATHAVQSPY